jgi:hypothetical protein
MNRFFYPIMMSSFFLMFLVSKPYGLPDEKSPKKIKDYII